MKTKLLAILVAIQVILLLVYFVDINLWNTNKLKADTGKVIESKSLSERSVTSFGQDDKLQMWVGTTSGLNVYAGNNFKQMFCDPSDTTTIPDNKILTIAKDGKNQMWVGTQNGVARHIGWFKFKRYAIPYSTIGVYQIIDFGENGVLINNGVAVYCIKDDVVKEYLRFKEFNLAGNFIYPDKLNKGYWIITPTSTCHYDLQGKQTMEAVRSNANLAYTYKDGDTVWYSQSRNVSAIDLKTNKIIYKTKAELPIIPTSLYPKDEYHVYLNSAFHGLYSLDTRTDELTKITDVDFHLRHKDVTISTFFEDKDKNLWVGFQYGSFQVISRSNVAYEYFNNKAVNNETKGLTITCLDAVGKDLIGSTEDEVFYYQASRDSYKHYLYKDIFTDSPYFRQTLEDVVQYDQNKVWLISNVRILSCELKNGEIRVLKRVFSREHHGPLLGTGLKVGNKILVATNSPYLLLSDFGSDKCDSILVNENMYGNESRLVQLNDGKVLIVMKGLEMAVFNPQTNKVEHLNVNKPEQLVNADPTFVFSDSKKRIWIGTRHNGLCQYLPERKEIGVQEDIPFNNIQSIQEDDKEQLWICSHDNLLAFNPQDRTIQFSSYPTSYNSFGHTAYYRNSCKPMGEKVLVFGTSEGCVTIPLTGERKGGNGKVRISGLSVQSNDGAIKSINSDFKQGDHYTFPHGERFLSIEFGSMSYGNLERVMYQYKMEGLDRDWSAPSLKPGAQYSNLPSGTYTFKVRQVSSLKTAPLSEHELKITIKPYFWTSAAAIYFYLLCLFGLILYVQAMYLRSQRNKLKMEQLENERLRDQQTNEMNMNFFTNISHEFRNPLTLIAGPLLMLKSDESLPRSARRSINAVCVSINRMLVLIDQMLDFNKLETDALRLEVADYDVISKLNSLTTPFIESANLRNIEVLINKEEANLYARMDLDKFEKIMSNLLTNALKHTPDNGHIEIDIHEIDGKALTEFPRFAEEKSRRCLRVSVYNNGNAIEEDKIPNIFKRYYQVHNTQSVHQYGWGTGVGLYYVKRLVGLHHGEIMVRNEAHGGVSFIFAIPIEASAFTKEEHVSKHETIMQIPTDKLTDETEDKVNRNQTNVNEAAKKPVVLIVDDDTSVAQYIRSLFINDYVVINKYSAETALRDMDTIKPDIILSDVVMGDMNGYEFCRTIKSELMTCHIPVILITAKSNVNEQIEGLEGGANAYVTKPFDPRYLKAIVDSQLTNVKLLRQKLGEGELTETVKEGLADQDRKFLNDLYELMEKHISEQDLNVTTISHELLISHSKFNYKLKELTGETPGCFFRKFKLNKAAKLLREGKHNVSEVAFITGFGTVSYFSVAFKKQFGVSPSDYR